MCEYCESLHPTTCCTRCDDEVCGSCDCTIDGTGTLCPVCADESDLEINPREEVVTT